MCSDQFRVAGAINRRLFPPYSLTFIVRFLGLSPVFFGIYVVILFIIVFFVTVACIFTPRGVPGVGWAGVCVFFRGISSARSVPV